MLDLMQGLEPYVISAFLIMLFIIVINSRETKYFKFYKEDKLFLLQETILLISYINDLKRLLSEHNNLGDISNYQGHTKRIVKQLDTISVHVMYGRLSGELYVYHGVCNVVKDTNSYLAGDLTYKELTSRVNKLDSMLNNLFIRLDAL